MPEVNVDMDAVAEKVKECLEEIPKAVEENTRNFKAEVGKLKEGEEFEVPDTAMKLKCKATDEEILAAAIASACATKVRDDTKAVVWGLVEEDVDAQLNTDELASVPDKMKEKAKEKAQENTTDKA